jgi:hypothetical protein
MRQNLELSLEHIKNLYLLEILIFLKTKNDKLIFFK